MVLDFIKDGGSFLSCYVPHLYLYGDRDFYPLTPIKQMSLHPMLLDNITHMAVSTEKDKQLGYKLGFVAVYEQPSSFTAATMVPIDEARRIIKIRGKFIDGITGINVKGIKQCNVSG